MRPNIEKQYFLENLYVNQKKSAKTSPLSEGKREFNERHSTINSDSLWYAIYFPQFKNLNEAQKEGYLNQLAVLVKKISSSITIQKQAIVCEVRSALRYFSGIDNIHRIIKVPIESKLKELQLPQYFYYAACPTITGSLLLARSGKKTLIYRKKNLRSALGKLPVSVLDLSRENFKKLNNMGVYYLKDLWVLPLSGLQKRFGSNLITTINKALCLKPEPIQKFTESPNFSSYHVLPYEIEKIGQLLPVIEKMLKKSCEFLRNNDLCITNFQVLLSHFRKTETTIDIGMRLPNRSIKRFSKLLRAHLENLRLSAPVVTVKLTISEFIEFRGYSEALPLGGGNREREGNSDLIELMEQFVARLGKDSVLKIRTTPNYCPELAIRQLRYDQIGNFKIERKKISLTPRPLMLLQVPKELAVKGGRLYNKENITIISGPERIETQWWNASDVLRDYYIALEQNGSRLWIYRERNKTKKWYLHGYFS